MLEQAPADLEQCCELMHTLVQVLEQKGYVHPQGSPGWARHPVFIQSFEVRAASQAAPAHTACNACCCSETHSESRSSLCLCCQWAICAGWQLTPIWL